MDFLRGKKTFIVAFLLAVATGAHYLGWIDTAMYQAFLGFLGAGGVYSFRDAMKG